MSAPQQAHDVAANLKHELGAGAAAARCDCAGTATRRDDGSSNVKVQPSRAEVDLAARVTSVCSMRRDAPSSQHK